MDIILYLIQLIQYLYKQNCWLVLFICKYIPLKQRAYDDSKSPAYQKFKIDELPRIISYEQDWKWNDLFPRYPISRLLTIVRLPLSVSNPLLTTMIMVSAKLLQLMKNTSKSVVLKVISGLSWMSPKEPSLAIRYLTTAVLVHAYFPCVWLLITLKKSLKTLNSLLIVIVPILSLHNSST